ncbi:hypothetical protein EDB81DRAFT_944639 [Dactylonectria macrodidyma]|uniref:Gamma-glutamylcyclotransferase AIG2-like domain-containing protein n=1 Tax=Dactylonectria macrodidyma TaxID=307937 RepID=A0A9P9F7I7_9HYPO|nr:hypothetical protein EDB81DRAFT_944639 [Dactylonectria macrodidyma]
MSDTSKPRLLFVYGTLRALPLLAWALTGDSSNTEAVVALTSQAKVYGYMHDSRYAIATTQQLLNIAMTPASMGESYKATPVTAILETGDAVEADMYVWNGDSEALLPELWELETFISEKTR